MEKQHYVPKIYLKQFSCTPDNSILGIKFIKHTNKWSKIKSYKIESICYQDDFYNLDELTASKEEVQNDFIERNAFWYERNFITTIIKKINNKNLEENDKYNLCRLFLSLKHRNPKFRKSISSSNLEGNLDLSILEVKKKYSGLDNEILNQILDVIKKNILLDKDSDKKLHNYSIYKTSTETNAIFTEVLKRVSQYSINVYEVPQKSQRKFITTDNPGYSIDNNGQIFNTKFKEDSCHFLPLSPLIGIEFINNHAPNRIHYRTPSETEIFKFNFSSALMRNTYLYFNESKVLKEFISKVYQ